MQVREQGEMVAVVSIDAPPKTRSTLYACNVVSKASLSLRRGRSGAYAYVTSPQERTSAYDATRAVRTQYTEALCAQPRTIYGRLRGFIVCTRLVSASLLVRVKNISRFAGKTPMN